MDDLDYEYFQKIFRKKFNEPLVKQEMPLSDILENMKLSQNGFLNGCGAFLFAKQPQYGLPECIVKAVSFNDTSLGSDKFLNYKQIMGRIEDIFDQTTSFVLTNLNSFQDGQGVNGSGQPEIPRVVIEELVANALVHCDYFIPAYIRVFIFLDRVEILSPGHLPNNLRVENIKMWCSWVRNPVLASCAYHIIPYHGQGCGIIRSLQAYPDIDFIDDPNVNFFRVIIKRRG